LRAQVELLHRVQKHMKHMRMGTARRLSPAC
jgi:hypothetical protein